jgi:hypothetical protein
MGQADIVPIFGVVDGSLSKDLLRCELEIQTGFIENLTDTYTPPTGTSDADLLAQAIMPARPLISFSAALALAASYSVNYVAGEGGEAKLLYDQSSGVLSLVRLEDVRLSTLIPSPVGDFTIFGTYVEDVTSAGTSGQWGG